MTTSDGMPRELWVYKTPSDRLLCSPHKVENEDVRYYNADKVQELVDAIEYERNAIFYAMTRGSEYDIGLAKERMTAVLQEWSKS